MSETQPEDTPAGQEVNAEDAGVPDDPPGKNVPEDQGRSDGTDVPADPTIEQPEGTEGVEGADPGDDDTETEEMAEADQEPDAETPDESGDGSGGDDSGGDDSGGDDSGDDSGGDDVASDIGAPTKPAEPA